jgi:hypothetical protein
LDSPFIIYADAPLFVTLNVVTIGVEVGVFVGVSVGVSVFVGVGVGVTCGGGKAPSSTMMTFCAKDCAILNVPFTNHIFLTWFGNKST